MPSPEQAIRADSDFRFWIQGARIWALLYRVPTGDRPDYLACWRAAVNNALAARLAARRRVAGGDQENARRCSAATRAAPLTPDRAERLERFFDALLAEQGHDVPDTRSTKFGPRLKRYDQWGGVVLSLRAAEALSNYGVNDAADLLALDLDETRRWRKVGPTTRALFQTAQDLLRSREGSA